MHSCSDTSLIRRTVFCGEYSHLSPKLHSQKIFAKFVFHFHSFGTWPKPLRPAHSRFVLPIIQRSFRATQRPCVCAYSKITDMFHCGYRVSAPSWCLTSHRGPPTRTCLTGTATWCEYARTSPSCSAATRSTSRTGKSRPSRSCSTGKRTCRWVSTYVRRAAVSGYACCYAPNSLRIPGQIFLSQIFVN